MVIWIYYFKRIIQKWFTESVWIRLKCKINNFVLNSFWALIHIFILWILLVQNLSKFDFFCIFKKQAWRNSTWVTQNTVKTSNKQQQQSPYSNIESKARSAMWFDSRTSGSFLVNQNIGYIATQSRANHWWTELHMKNDMGWVNEVI